MDVPPVAPNVPRLLAGEANTYAGADLVNAIRLVGVIAGLSGLLTVAYFAFDPPTETVGGAGWALAGALAAASLVAAARLLRQVAARVQCAARS